MSYERLLLFYFYNLRFLGRDWGSLYWSLRWLFRHKFPFFDLQLVSPWTDWFGYVKQTRVVCSFHRLSFFFIILGNFLCGLPSDGLSLRAYLALFGVPCPWGSLISYRRHISLNLRLNNIAIVWNRFFLRRRKFWRLALLHRLLAMLFRHLTVDTSEGQVWLTHKLSMTVVNDMIVLLVVLHQVVQVFFCEILLMGALVTKIDLITLMLFHFPDLRIASLDL